MDTSKFIKVAKVNDFLQDNIKSFNLFGKKIGILRNSDGSLSAIEVGCKHQGADLTKGEISGHIATCHRHQWKYDLHTGKCLNHDSPDLKKYGLEVRGDDIYISLAPLD